jgi:hypothetical protein
MSPNPNQKTRGQYCEFACEEYGWIFIWSEFGFDPEKSQWRKSDGEGRWLLCDTSEVPSGTRESCYLFFSKAVTI